jgi:hypothetical protein
MIEKKAYAIFTNSYELLGVFTDDITLKRTLIWMVIDGSAYSCFSVESLKLLTADQVMSSVEGVIVKQIRLNEVIYNLEEVVAI